MATKTPAKRPATVAAKEEILPKCRRARMDLASLAQPLARRKEELMTDEVAA